jgi:hypothetical protein
MPAEHDAAEARQLEALRRHMAHPDTRWEPPTEVGLLRDHSAFDLAGPERRRPPRSWLLLTGLLVTLALVGGVVVGAVAWSDDRPAPSPTGSPAPHPGDAPPGPPPSPRWPRRPARRRSTGPTRCSPAPSGCGRRWPSTPGSCATPATAGAPATRCSRGSPRRSGPGPASRPGSTAPWTNTARSWTSAACAYPEPVPHRIGSREARWAWRRRWSRWPGASRSSAS